MKIAKKSLSIFLSLLMMFGACSVALTGLSVTSYAATGTLQSVKNALTDEVVEQIVYHGDVQHNNYTYKGDVDVVLAADEIYAYAMSLRKSGVTDTQNSTAGLLAAVAANTGFTSGDKYTALKYILDPVGDTITAIESAAAKNKSGECDGCDHTASYPSIPTDALGNHAKKTVKVYATVSSLLEKYSDLNSIPTSLLQGVQYDYSMITDQAVQDENEHKSGCDTVYDCVAYRWNYFRNIHRTEIKNIVSIKELKDYGETLASADLSMTFDEMVALSAAELDEIYNENYGPYQEMIDKYTFENVKKLFGSYNEYFDNLLKAKQINLAMPALDILIANYGKEYDKTNYDEMAAIFAPMNAAYDVIKDFSSDVFAYIGTKDEYKDVDLVGINTYLEELTYNKDLIVLTNLKAAIRADLDANADAVANINDVTNPATDVLKALLAKLNSYSEQIDAANGRAVTVVMQNEKVEIAEFVEKLEKKLALRADTEAEFDTLYAFWTPVFFGDYTTLTNDQLISMYEDYDANVESIKVAYAALIKDQPASIVDPLFSVTIGEGGTPTLLQTAAESMKTSAQAAMKAEMLARVHAQLEIASASENLTTDITLNNFIIVGSVAKAFDQNLYDFCNHADRNWVPAADKEIYNKISTVLTAYNNFVNKLNSEGFQKVELDKDGVYVIRDVYENDLVKEEAYTVTTDKFNQTVVKLDNFLASEDFGALLGLENENGDPLGLGDYLYDLIGGFLFSSDLINMVVGMLFPMIEDLLKTAIPDLLNGEDVNPDKVPPNDLNALGYVAIGALLDGAEGGIDVYLDDNNFLGQNRKQQTYESLLKNAGLNIFPKLFADSMVASGVITTSSEVYKELAAAGATWTNLGVFDPETETFSYDFDFDWGVTDKASFAKAFGGVLDSIKPLLPTAFLNQALDITLGTESAPAGVGYGSIKYSIVSISNHEFYATLPIALQPLNVYGNIIQPLFKALGLNANASLSSSSKGIDYANAILNPVFELLDKVAANPLDTILGLLPSLAELLATDFVDELLGKIMIDVSVSLKIVGSDDGTFDTLAGLLGSLLTFELFGKQLGIADIAGAATMEALLGVDIRDINNLLDFVFEKLNVDIDLPDIDQVGLMQCAKWNSKHNLTADKADVLFFLLNYVAKALGTDFLASLIGGDEEPNEILTNVLGAVKASAVDHPGHIVAAIVELINPVEYSLKPMTWAEGPAESVVYLNYANDWTKSESQYLIDNALDIVNSVLAMSGKEALDLNVYLSDLINGLFEDNFTNATITGIVETFATMAPLADILNTILVDELGVDMGAWANDFGYLFNEEVAAPETTVLGVTAVKDAEGNIVWNGLADGDRDAFIDTLLALFAPFAPAVAWLFGGEDIGVFNVVELKGYDSFDSTLGVLLKDVLGVNLPAVDFANKPMESLNAVADAAFAWLDETLAADNLAERAVNLVADLLWYVDSNGLSVLLNNLLLPVLALVDTVRPIIDVDVDTILSVIVSDLINGKKLDLDKILDMLFGTFEGNDDILVSVTLDSINLATVFAVVDKMFGSDLTHSSLVTVGLKGIRNADLDAADALTIILSSVIDCLDEPAAEEGKTNAQAIFAFVEEKTGNDNIGEIVAAVLDIIGGIVYEYTQPNWGYMFGLDEEFNTTLPEHSIVYLGYTNNWTQETADAVYGSLEDIVKIIFDAVPALQGKTIATLVNGLLEDNVYSDEIVNTVVELLVNLISALDETLRDTVDVVVDTDIATWFSFCTYNAETEKYECTKDWNVTDKDSFVAAIKEVLAPANQLLAFLFFGDGYEFFTASTGKSLITLNGGEGYAKGLVPILEALGLEMKPASAYLVNGRYDVPAAIEDIFNAALGLVDKVSAAPVEEAFKLIPNLIYFINADGAKSSVNNILSPVNAILEKLSPIVDFSLGEFVAEKIGFDISDITTDALLKLAADNGIVMNDKLVNLIKTFYIGELTEFTSANGDLAYRMTYTDEESASDMLTIVLSLAIDLFKQNEVLFADLLGDENYYAIMKLLGLNAPKPMQEFDWIYTEYADTDKTFTAIESSGMFHATYNEDWTKDKAQYIVDNGTDVITNVLHVLNLKINGQKITDLESLLNNLLSSLYSQENADAILALVKDLIAKLSDLEPYGDLIKTVAKSALGVDLTVYDNMTVTVEDGNRESFSNALGQILAPVVPVLEILLTSKDVSFLVDIEGENAITIFGSEGYAYGIIPLLEALGCPNVMTPDEYKAAVAADPSAAITAIINPLFDRIDALAADPFNQLLELLPGVIYFINSNGLDTVVKNVLNTVDTVLECLEPLIGMTSIVDLLGIDLSTYDFEYLFNMLIDMAEESTGFSLKTIAGDAIAELTVGRVVSYESKNGETYYTMKYATDSDKADMVTVLLRLIIAFVTEDENIVAIEGMLKDVVDGEDAYKSVCTILETLASAVKEEPNMSKALAYIYYLFVTVDVSTDIADEIYHDVTNSWEYILKMLETSEEPLLRDLAKAIKKALNDNFGTDYEINEEVEEEKPLTGFALFIDKIKKFFEKIGEFFRNLFGGTAE